MALPGTSEHQTGLAADVGLVGLPDDQVFGGTPASAWVADNAHRFGFILRYPPDKAAITGYANEPWHLRYVGVDLAAELHASGLTMEEHFGLVPTATGARLDQAELGDRVALVDELGDRGVDLGAAVVVDVETLDDRVLAAGARDREAGDDALGDAVAAVGGDPPSTPSRRPACRAPRSGRGRRPRSPPTRPTTRRGPR